MTTARITHIAERAVWHAAQEVGTYAAGSLETEGFIHCSTPWQVERTAANAAFAARDDLVLLVIDPTQLDAGVTWENCEGGLEPFPHLYGELPVHAVERVWPLEWDRAKASYRFPPEWSTPSSRSSAFQHACYRVGDITRSLAFYAALGFEERRRFEFSDVETKVMIGLPGDGDRLGLTFVAGVDSWELGTGYNHVALTVVDMAATLGRLATLGCEPEQPPFRPRPQGSLVAFVADPDGYRIELIEKA